MEEGAGVDDEVSAVGLVECACFDECEVGDEVAHFGHVLDAADEVFEGGVIAVDDGAAHGVLVIDEAVDAVALDDGA